ncbi:MAG: ABC transporter ATP-binding protein [Aeromicrobium sp.]|nr:ABC transporter ATP-binding protein [Aeromicrobium sp.]
MTPEHHCCSRDAAAPVDHHMHDGASPVHGAAHHTHDDGRLAGAEEVVRISCVRHTYEDGTSVHLCGLDFVAHRGARVAVLGPNGAGKTTMLFHILGLLTPEEGEVRVFGVEPSAEWTSIRRRIGVVLQNVDEQLLAPTVIDDVAFSPRQYGLPEAEALDRAHAALAMLGIEHLASRVPHNLSGGEKRKVALAGALVMDPELLVLDEPFEGLDPTSRAGLLGLLDTLARDRDMTIVLTTHDIDTVPEFADYAYVLAPGGTIALYGTPAELFASADVLAEGNIRPPILAELFARLRERDPSAPAPALSVAEAVDALEAWKGCAG